MVHQLIGEDKRFLFEADEETERQISNILKKTIKKYGPNNSFTRFINKIYKKRSVQNAKDLTRKISFLENSWSKDDIDISKSFYERPSLYQRNLEDFAYTVNALELLSNPIELSKYIDNYEDIDENVLINKSNGTIKSANEIYYILDNLSQKSEEKNKEYTLLDYLVELFNYPSNKQMSSEMIYRLFEESKNYDINANTDYAKESINKILNDFVEGYNKGRIKLSIPQKYIEIPQNYIDDVASEVYKSLNNILGDLIKGFIVNKK